MQKFQRNKDPKEYLKIGYQRIIDQIESFATDHLFVRIPIDEVDPFLGKHEFIAYWENSWIDKFGIYLDDSKNLCVYYANAVGDGEYGVPVEPWLERQKWLRNFEY